MGTTCLKKAQKDVFMASFESPPSKEANFSPIKYTKRDNNTNVMAMVFSRTGSISEVCFVKLAL